MGLTRTKIAVAFFIFCLPMQAQQTTTQQRPTPPARDPNAVAVVQTAIQALGGETLIKQFQTVAFQGSTTGASQGAYAVTWQALQPPAPKTASTTPIKRPFAPASVADMLVWQLHAPFSLKYVGPVVLGTDTFTAVSFSFSPPANLPQSSSVPQPPDQVWYFDLQTVLPRRVEYQLTSKPGVIQLQAIDFSDYRSVSGVLYPFSMVIHRDDLQNQTITIQTVTPSTAVQPPQ
jgi:hypothetical protein